MIIPHGGRLIDRTLSEKERARISENFGDYPSLEINNQIAQEINNIAYGVFSPLEGFLIQEDFTLNQNLLTVDELAESLSVQKSWVYSRTRETGPDAMPRIKVGKYCRFVLDDVLDWLKSQNEAD